MANRAPAPTCCKRSSFKRQNSRQAANDAKRRANAARVDDNKGLKGTVLDWITDQVKGLVPPIICTKMSNRSFNHEVTGKYLCPTDYTWTDDK